MDDGIGREVDHEVVGAHALRRDFVLIPRDGPPPDRLLIVEVPDLAEDIQQQNIVRVPIGWIAVDLGTVSQLP